MSTNKARVFLVDDDTSMLRSLGRALQVAGYEVESFSHPRQMLERALASGPACVVLDLRMPELDGLELQERLVQAGWTLPMLFISGHGDVPAAVRAMKAGAVDFLSKPFSTTDLLAAVERAIQRSSAEHEAHAEHEALRALFSQLTEREWDVCRRVARGMLNKQIAADLGTAEQTVRVQRARLMKKLGVDSVAEMVKLLSRLDSA